MGFNWAFFLIIMTASVHSLEGRRNEAVSLDLVNVKTLISKLLVHPEFSICSVAVVDFKQKSYTSNYLVSHLSTHHIHDIYTLSFPLKNETEKRLSQVTSHKRFTCHCSLVAIFLGRATVKEISSFPLPFFAEPNDLIKRDQDYFIFFTDTESEASLQEVLESDNFGKKLKYKAGMVLNPLMEEDWIRDPYKRSGNAVRSELSDSIIQGFQHSPLLNMNGRVFRISTPLSTRWMNQISINAKGELTPVRGPYKLVLDLLESQLNFSSVHFPSTGGGTGAIVNGIWIGTVGDVLYGRAEIGQVTAETYMRNSVVSNSFPVSHEWLTFSTQIPQPYFSWLSVYEPLALEVWVGVVFAGVVAWFIFYALFPSNDDGISRNLPRPVGMLTLYVIGTLLDQDVPSPEYSLRRRIPQPLKHGATRAFTIFWLLYALLIGTAYRSKLVTFLAFPHVEEPPKSFEELATSPLKIGLQYIKGAAFQVFKNSKNPTYSKIFKRMSLVESDVECFQKAAIQKFACISWDSIAEFVRHRNLTDTYGRSPVMKSPSSTLNINAGFVTEKRAVFKEEIDHVLRWITDTGLLIKIWALDFQYIRAKRNEWLEETGAKRPDYGNLYWDNGQTRSLSIKHFSGSFYILGVCTLVTLVVFVLEMRFLCFR